VIQRLRRVPGPLAVVLVVALIQALAWIVLMPPFQGPDEDSHFTYVQRVWERHTIPWTPSGGTIGRQQGSDELQAALVDGGFGPLRANVTARPLWTRADERLWARAATGTDRGNGGYTTALKNPPLYYLYEQIPYGVGTGGTIWDRSLLTRLANVPLLLIALVFVWLLAGELLGRGPWQFLATSAAAFVPALFNEVATVNPDIGLVAIWSAALYLMALIVRRGLRRSWLVWLVLLNVGGALTQPRSVPLILPSAMAVLLALARERDWRRVTPLRVAIAGAVAFLLVTFAWASIGSGNPREFASYLWQFYLPKLGFMNTTIGPPTYDVHVAFVSRLFGTLAQLEVTLPPTLDDIAWWAARLGLIALVVALVLRRRALRQNAALAVVLFTAIWSLVLALHLVAYRSMLTNPGDPIVTGRYLLPLIGLFGIAIAIGGSALPRPWRGGYAGLVLAAGVALQLISVGLLVERFYA
jgi:4-amino-4-deoxy-L-arabinose transferase-like glycosyltransferase